MRTTTQRKHDRRTKHEPQNVRSAGTGDQSKTAEMGEKAKEGSAEEEMSKIYLSGPITGVPDFMERFKRAEDYFADKGHTVINPAILPLGLKPADYMRISLAELEAAEKIVLLPGWQNSKGANIEKLYAEYIGLEVVEL